MPKSYIQIAFLSAAITAWCHVAEGAIVRPVITFGGEIVDGLIVNGATSNSVEFSDAARTARSSVDLASGEMRLFASGEGATVSSSAQGIMGDSLTFLNGAGTTVNFTWGLEAIIDAEIFGDTPNNSFILYGLTVGVYEQGLVDHTNWFGRSSEATFFQTLSGDLGNSPTDIVGTSINETINGAITLGSNNESFDFFFSAMLAAASNNELISYTLDGEHTASAGVSVEGNVIVTSGSGEFLGYEASAPVVPEASSMAIWGIGGILALAYRKIAS
jgi:hypothetical protein